MSRFLRLVLAASVLLSSFPLALLLPDRTAHALDSGGAAEVVTGLQSLGTLVGSLADYEALGDPIPFIGTDPSEALSLDTLFADALGALGAPSSLADLATVLDAKDDPNLNGTGTAVAFDNVVGDDTANSLSFEFTATRTVNVPLRFADGDVNLAGSEAAVTFALTAPMALGYDAGADTASEKVYLTGDRTVTVTASTDVPAISTFESLVGFTGVTVGGSLALNVAVDATLTDPDDNGRLTMDEWASTALGDLVSVAFADGPGDDVNGNLTLDASIVPGAPDASVVWVEASLADGPSAPIVTLDALADFTTISAIDVFGGLTSATNALLAAQQTADLQLPFLKDGLSDVVRFGDPLVRLVHELGDVAIVCGSENGVPPTGPTFGLGAGATVYCQGYTLSAVDQAQWQVDGVAVTPDPDPDLNTVGIKPSATVELTLVASGMDGISLDFHIEGEVNPDDTSTMRLGRPLFLSAEQLTAKLLSIAGIDTVTTVYDTATRTLTYHLQESIPDASEVVEPDFGDRLKQQAGLFGLSQTGDDEITVEASNIALDVTFGVILVPDPAAIKVGGTDADRFFLQVNPSGDEFQADVAIAAGSGFELQGRLAFLEVTAGGVTTAGNPGGAVFALIDSDDAPGAPAFRLNIEAPGVPGVSLPQPIPDAILISDLIAGGIGQKIDAQCELGLSSGLEVAATVGAGTPLASGQIAVSWPDVFQDGGCVPDLGGVTAAPDGQFETDLLAFDIDQDNPLAMLSIMLNAISGLAGGIDSLPSVGDLDTRIPVVGVSPRDLMDTLEEISTVISDAASDPAESLQVLETQLETELGIDADALAFELGNVGPGAEKDLILRLGFRKDDAIVKPLNVELVEGGRGLVSASNEGNVSFAYTVGAQFDVAVPLKPNSTVADTLVLETTQATVSGELEDSDLDFSAAVGPLAVGIKGEAKIDVDVAIANTATSPLPAATWITGVGVDLTGDTVDCGVVDVDPDPNVTDDRALTGQACALLDLDVAGPIGTLGFRAEDITAPDDLTDHPGWFVYVPTDLDAQIANNVLDWGFLFKVLPDLTDRLEAMLEGGAEDVSVPGLGEALDAGADVVGVMNDDVITPLSDIASQVTGTTSGQVEASIRAEVLTIPVLLDLNGDGVVDDSDVDVVTYCGGTACGQSAPLTSIDDVQVAFKIGQEVTESPDFDIGIDGLPIEVTGAMKANASWSLLLSVGLSKAEGPYVVANATPDPELNLSASVGLDDNLAPGSCAADPSDPQHFPAGDFGGGSFSDTRCLEGKLAFLSVGLYDGDNENDADDTNDPTKIELTTTLDLTSSAPSGRLTAGNIINSVGLEPRFVASANVDLAMRTSIDVVDGLPGVVGAVHVAWVFDTDDPDLGVPTVAFDRLHLDAGTFVSDLLGPVVVEVRRVTSPLEPIVDFIQADVPVLTQLAEMVGEDPVTVLTLIKQSGGFSDEDIALIESVLQLIALANNLPADAGAGLFIPLGSSGPGSFTLFGAKLLQGATTPDQAQTLMKDSDAGTNLADQLPGNNSLMTLATTRPGTFGVEGLTFPFLDDATEIFGLLLGKDVTIVRMDFGTFKASVSQGYEFGPIFIGPFPVTAEVGLAFTAEARFAMGYDTRGLRMVIAGGSAVKLFNGIFIDDLDYDGLDVDEWRLTFRVHAEASLDAVIVEAGIYGGVDAILSGDLDDPNPDGKLYIDEIVDKIGNPICLFIISGKLDLFMGVYLELDLFFWSHRWNLEIVRMTLLDFTMGCKGTNPNLADVDGGDLYLNIGTRAHLRGIQETQVNEVFTVRQIGPGKVSVEAFGLKQERSGITGIVKADALDGDDVIALIGGGDGTDPVAFTIDSNLVGGDGNDSLTGGEGVDTLSGGKGVDKLIGGKGDDILSGDGDDDRIEGGLGVDTLDGGAGNDMVSGGPGGDTVTGGPGNDALLGGPWSPGSASSPGGFTDGLDGADTMSGGWGDDIIDGGPDDDVLQGDEPGLSCLADGDTAGGKDSILGGPGNDTLIGGNGDDTLVGNGGHVGVLMPYSDNDRLCGNGGDDLLDGDDDNPAHDQADRDAVFAGGLFGGSGEDKMYGRGGADEMWGGAHDDEMWGGPGGDTMNGESGADRMHGEAGADHMDGSAGEDRMHGGDDADTMNGNDDDDTMFGDAADDLMHGNSGADVMRGGSDDDTMWGDTGDDEMYGDSGEDLMYGNLHDDTMRGGQHDDDMEGNAGEDTIYGDAGQDNLIGGSTDALAPDGADLILGNGAVDFIAGDNAVMARLFTPRADDPTADDRAVTLYNVDSPDGSRSGDDTVYGGEGNDWIWGQGGNDTAYGGPGTDRIEGNAHDDELRGGAGDDRIVGGSTDNATLLSDGRISTAFAAMLNAGVAHGSSGAELTRVAAGPIHIYLPAITNGTMIQFARAISHFDALDGADDLYGDGDEDVLLGDNGTLDMQGLTNMRVTSPGTYGDDTIHGGAGDDQAYGQLGNDTIYGEGEADYAVGDLGAFTPPTSGPPVWPGGAPNRSVALIAPDVGGADEIDGGSGDDHLYGGAMGDVVAGGLADDHVEGNGGSDALHGLSPTFEISPTAEELAGVLTEGDRDDIIGGSSAVHPDFETGASDGGEVLMQGNADSDVMIGDNGEIVRFVDTGAWRTDSLTGDVWRSVTLYDETRTEADLPPLSDVNGGDRIEGNGGRDRLFGQGMDDCMKGDDEVDLNGTHDDDYLEGNQGQDWIEGNEADDDVIGGGPRTSDDAEHGYPDARDFLFGGTGADVMVGDNAVITRSLAAPNSYYIADRVGMAHPRAVLLLDMADPPPPANFGDDQMSGGPGVDVLFGQDGHDIVTGGTNDDYAEGNGGHDWVFGDRPLGSLAPGVPMQLPAGLPAPPPSLASCGLGSPIGGTDGQDDLLGGSSLEGHRDEPDWIYGDGGADFALGDNGELLRVVEGGAEQIEVERYPIGSPPADARIIRRAVRYDVTTWSIAGPGDYMEGNAGDDALWGENHHDELWGNAGDDDLFGELGDDALFGGPGQDALVGDRGSVKTRLVDGSPGDPSTETVRANVGGRRLTYVAFPTGTLLRRVDLLKDHDGKNLVMPCQHHGGDDLMRGGPDNDVLHGCVGDDLMNGDSGGDVLFGHDGSDVLWGGRGSPSAANANDRGIDDAYVDYVFGGHGGLATGPFGNWTGGVDLLDYHPRNQDPQAWRDATAAYTDGQGETEEPLSQDHQGVDLLYGGWDRDVFQSDVTDDGGVIGDRLIDWYGRYNLYTHCNTGAHRITDITEFVPTLVTFLRKVGYGSGLGEKYADVQNTHTSAFRELAIVIPPDDASANSGTWPSNQPGSFEHDLECD